MDGKRTLPLLAATALLVAPGALALGLGAVGDAGCSVPCGYIYPLLVIGVDGKGEVRPLSASRAIEVPATLSFRFDVMNEGISAPNPQEPIVVTFEFPRKPAWAEIEVDPPRIDIPITPQYVQPDATDPQNVQAKYHYEVPVAITIRMTGQAVLADGLDYAKLLVFAKSTESGLYKAGYGIKEFRVAPEGAVHESDLERAAPLTVEDFPAVTLAPASATGPGLTATLTPPAGPVEPWHPATFTLDVGAPARVSASLVDESGAIAYASGARRAADGIVELNLTIPGPGRHTLVAHVTPEPGPEAAAFAPQAVAFPLVVGPTTGDAVRYPKEYVLATREVVSDFRADAQGALTQFEKAIPFPVLEGSSGAAVTLSLQSANAGPLPTGAGNLMVQMIDPEGGVVLQMTVDAANPVRSAPVGALPATGWFHVRVSGVGVPFETAYGVKVTVNYDDAPVARRATDGVADAALGPVTLGRMNVTFEAPGAAAVAPWESAALTFGLMREGGDVGRRVSFALSVVGESDGSLVYASGRRATVAPDDSLAASFTPPAPGRYLAVAHVAPLDAGPAFEDFVAAFPVVVGDPSARDLALPTEFILNDVGVLAGPSPVAGPVAEYRLPDGPAGSIEASVAGSTPASGLAYEIVGADGSPASESDAGPKWLRVTGRVPGPTEELTVGSTLLYAASTVANPNYEGPSLPARKLPGPALLIVALAVVGAAIGLAAAAARRR